MSSQIAEIPLSSAPAPAATVSAPAPVAAPATPPVSSSVEKTKSPSKAKYYIAFFVFAVVIIIVLVLAFSGGSGSKNNNTGGGDTKGTPPVKSTLQGSENQVYMSKYRPAGPIQSGEVVALSSNNPSLSGTIQVIPSASAGMTIEMRFTRRGFPETLVEVITVNEDSFGRNQSQYQNYQEPVTCL